MRYTLTINSLNIPSVDILEIKLSEKTLKFMGQNLISAKIEIVLSNADYVYDDRKNTQGYFENQEWYNWTITVDDNILQRRVWFGRLKEISLSDDKLEVKLTSLDFVQDMADTVCVIDETSKTCSEIAYAIITECLEISEDYIVKSGFDEASAIQTNELLNAYYTSEDNIKCISVIEELCKISDMFIYSLNNLIACWQWRPYSGSLGVPITNRDIFPLSYSHIVSESNHEIYNSYSILYKSGSNVVATTGYDYESELLYGKNKTFAVPKEIKESGLAADYKLLFTTKAGADAAGARILSHYKDIIKIASFTISYEFNDILKLGDIADMRFSPYVREPILVTSIKEDDERRTLQIQGECVNYKEGVVLDLIIPDSLLLLFVYPEYNQNIVWLFWTRSNETDLFQYKLYFTGSGDNWEGEMIGSTMSPKTIYISDLLFYQENCVDTLDGVEEDSGIKFKVSCLDSSYNEALVSNSLDIDTTKQIRKATLFGKYDAYERIKLNNKFINSIIESYIVNSDINTFSGGITILDIQQLDSDSFIVCYKDTANSSYGTCRTVDLNGTLGTASVFKTANITNAKIYIPNDYTVIVFYYSAGNHRYKIGDLNTARTVITWGSELTPSGTYFDFSQDFRMVKISSTKVLHVYYDGSYYLSVCVGTYNGSTEVVFSARTTIASGVDVTYTECILLNENKFIVTWYGGRFVVGTISGTTIAYTTSVLRWDTPAFETYLYRIDSSVIAMLYVSYNSGTGKNDIRLLFAYIKGADVTFSSYTTLSSMDSDPYTQYLACSFYRKDCLIVYYVNNTDHKLYYRKIEIKNIDPVEIVSVGAETLFYNGAVSGSADWKTIQLTDNIWSCCFTPNSGNPRLMTSTFSDTQISYKSKTIQDVVVSKNFDINDDYVYTLVLGVDYIIEELSSLMYIKFLKDNNYEGLDIFCLINPTDIPDITDTYNYILDDGGDTITDDESSEIYLEVL